MIYITFSRADTPTLTPARMSDRCIIGGDTRVAECCLINMVLTRMFLPQTTVSFICCRSLTFLFNKFYVDGIPIFDIFKRSISFMLIAGLRLTFAYIRLYYIAIP